MVNQEKIWKASDKYNSSMECVERLDQYAMILAATGQTDTIKEKAKTIYRLAQELRESEYKWYIEELKTCNSIEL